MRSSLTMLGSAGWCWGLVALLCACAAAEEARIVLGPETISVLDGTPALFVCKAEGSPAPEIEWLVNDKRLTSAMSRFFSFAISFGKVLRIDPTRAAEDNNTKVACVAKNAVSLAAASMFARLYIYPKTSVSPSGFPRILKGPSLLVVEKDQRVLFTCQVAGMPQPKVIWAKDYIPLEMTSPRYQLESNGNLVIKQALPQDEGKYACIARNEHGSVESQDAHLFVRAQSSSSPHTPEPPESLLIDSQK